MAGFMSPVRGKAGGALTSLMVQCYVTGFPQRHFSCKEFTVFPHSEGAL